jgi:glycosyltransferase involved in cell wall biosynthesis
MSAEPHVLHVFSSTGLYGAEHMVLNLIPALMQMGIQSTLACIDNPHLDQQQLYLRASALGIPARRIPCSGRLDHATTRSLKGLLRQHPGAIMHVHGYKSAFYALRARRFHPGTPIVATVHGWVINTRSLWLYRMLELWMLRRAQRVCIVGEAMRRPLKDSGIPAERICLVENGIDTSRFRPDTPAMTRGELGIPRDAFVFGSVMRLSSEKNPLGLLEAFTRVAVEIPQTWLVLVGDGPQRAEIQKRLHGSPIAGRVCLLGARNDPERVYPLLNCFVLPSLTEGLPLALLEAMACECPVIASNVGQIERVLDDLPSSLVPAGDIEALAAAMRRAMDEHALQPDLRQRVLTRYSVARMARDYAGIYRELEVRHVDQAA